MFVSALVQYNSSNDSLGANLRFRWEFQPGSELFVVYNEQRDTLAPSFPELENRAFIIKINRLFRFQQSVANVPPDSAPGSALYDGADPTCMTVLTRRPKRTSRL